MRIAWSLRASSWDRILRSRFLRAKTRFSEFLMWWVCSFLMRRSIPLDCIFRCMNVSARSRLPFNTLTLIPLHCSSCSFGRRFNRVEACLATEFIFLRFCFWMKKKKKRKKSYDSCGCVVKKATCRFLPSKEIEDNVIIVIKTRGVHSVGWAVWTPLNRPHLICSLAIMPNRAVWNGWLKPPLHLLCGAIFVLWWDCFGPDKLGLNF